MHLNRLSAKLAPTGTIQSRLDPFNKYDDAKLWDALRRSCLVDPDSSKDQPTESDETVGCMNQHTLDIVIMSEGANLSVGEHSLLSPGTCAGEGLSSCHSR